MKKLILGACTLVSVVIINNNSKNSSEKVEFFWRSVLFPRIWCLFEVNTLANISLCILMEGATKMGRAFSCLYFPTCIKMLENHLPHCLCSRLSSLLDWDVPAVVLQLVESVSHCVAWDASWCADRRMYETAVDLVATGIILSERTAVLCYSLSLGTCGDANCSLSLNFS